MTAKQVCRVLSVVLWACVSSTAAAAAPGGRENVVFIVWDSARADHMGAYGYSRNTTPHSDSLAREGVLFRSHYSHSTWTVPSMWTMFQSRLPETHGQVDWHVTGEDTDRLYDVLGNAGYATSASTDTAAQFGDLVDQSLKWVGENRRRPFFVLIRGWNTHISYQCPENFRDQYDPAYVGPIHEKERQLAPSELIDWMHDIKKRADPRDSESDLRHVMAHYDGCLSYSDHHLGRLLERLASWGLLDSTHIIITSDHGEGLDDPNESLSHMTGTFRDSVIHVPLIWRLPGARFAGRTVPAITGHVDLMPTLFSLLGLEAPRWFQGEDLSPWISSNPDRAPHEFIYGSEVIEGQWKWMLRSSQWKLVIQGTKHSLHDLRKDPKEMLNLEGRPPVVFLDLSSRILSARQEFIRQRDLLPAP